MHNHILLLGCDYKVKKAMKIMGGIVVGSMIGLIGYTMLNKKTRKKAEDLADTMISEAKAMVK